MFVNKRSDFCVYDRHTEWWKTLSFFDYKCVFCLTWAIYWRRFDDTGKQLDTMKCDSNKQGRVDEEKALSATIYSIQISHFVQSARRWVYFTGKNQASSIVREQTVSLKPIISAPLQPTLKNRKVGLTCKKISNQRSIAERFWENKKLPFSNAQSFERNSKKVKMTFNKFWLFLILYVYLLE